MNAPFPRDSTRLQPLGLAYIAAVLEESGYHVKIVDGDLHKLPPLELLKQVLQCSHGSKKKVVGFSTNVGNWTTTIEIAKKIRQNLPHAFIIFGGYYATSLHERILREFPFVDCIVRGEGEYTMLELCGRIEDDKNLDSVQGTSFIGRNGIQVNPPRALIKDLDILPFPARHKLSPLQEYSNKNKDKFCSGSLISSRGCPFNCTFCSIKKFYSECLGPRWRARSSEKVVDEIEELIELGAQYLIFVDDLILYKSHHIQGIINEISRRGLKISFQFSSRPDLIIKNKRIFPSLKEIGCKAIEVGVESGSEKVLKRYRKGITVQQCVESIKILKRNSIMVSLNLIMFDPYTTLVDLGKNIEFLEKIQMFPRNVFRTFLLTIPGTDVHERLVQDKLITEELGRDCFDPFQIDYFKNKKVKLIFQTLLEFSQEYDKHRRRLEEKTQRKLSGLRSRTQQKHDVDPKLLGELEMLQGRVMGINVLLNRMLYLFLRSLVRCAKKHSLDEILELFPQKIQSGFEELRCLAKRFDMLLEEEPKG